MANGGNGRKKGGPLRIEIDWKKFEAQCSFQCTLREIADYFNCSEDTIERRVREHYGRGFAEIFKKKRVVGLYSLRVNLFRLSEHHPAVAIFLAKNWLGMTDRQEITGPEGQPLIPAGGHYVNIPIATIREGFAIAASTPGAELN